MTDDTMYISPLDGKEEYILLTCINGAPNIRIGPYQQGPAGNIRNTAPILAFVPLGGNNKYGQPMGQLRLTASLWAAWFDGKELDADYRDLPTAVATLLRSANIYLACSVCEYLTKSAKDLEAHIARHKDVLATL